MIPRAPSKPIFSIIIPTYSRPIRLSACLKSLTHLDYPCKKLEVIVVNDGGFDPAQSLIRQTRKIIPISLYSKARSGPAATRNFGAKYAKGKYLAFTDDDCKPDPSWLRCLAARFASAPASMVGGRTINGLEGNVFAVASQMVVSYLYAVNKKQSGHKQFFASNNFAVPEDLFWKTGGFDETFPLAAGEDRDFCYRWRQNGYEMNYAPEVIVSHFHDLRFHSFLLQHFNYGQGAFQFYKKLSNRRRGTSPFQAPSFYLNLLRYPFSCSKSKKSSFLIPLLAISQLATFSGYMRQRYRSAYQDLEIR